MNSAVSRGDIWGGPVASEETLTCESDFAHPSGERK
jgi:hypothetical protein